MATVEEDFGHRELVGGGVTTLHRHPSNVKSNVILNVADGSSGTVVFSTPFEVSIFVTPHVILTLRGDTLAVDLPLLTSVTLTGFSWAVHKGHGGKNHTWSLHWIATDAGNL